MIASGVPVRSPAVGRRIQELGVPIESAIAGRDSPVLLVTGAALYLPRGKHWQRGQQERRTRASRVRAPQAFSR